MARTLVLANQKGGVGKTTTAVNLAAELASQGHRVLLIDIDPQGNATSSLGVEKNTVERSTYEVLIDGQPIAACRISGVRPRLDLLPANGELAAAEVELVGLRRREFRLREALELEAGRYDVVVIDCPPSLGLLTVNALTAADEVVVPIQCEYLALEGLMQLINTIDLVKRRLNPPLDVLAVVMTMFDARTRLSAQVVEDVQRFFPSRTLESVIPRTVRLAEAPSYGQTIFEYDGASRAASAYRDASQEIAARLGLRTPAEPPLLTVTRRREPWT
ncbi:MAG TPA: AAA family ATPase [Thermomicrobiaceae bacterium]|nr:AAA family ATPase [Thermomicrobiaceae bacterium]